MSLLLPTIHRAGHRRRRGGLAGAAYRLAVLSSAPTVYWSLGGGEPVASLGSANVVPTIFGAPDFTRPPLDPGGDGAGLFSASGNYLEAPTGTAFIFPLAVEFLFEPTSSPATRGFCVRANRWRFEYATGTDLYLAHTLSNGVWNYKTAAYALAVGSLYHLAFSIGARAQIWANGVRVYDAATSYSTATGSDPVQVGRTVYGSGPPPAAGVIDEFAVYRRELTTAEVLAHAQAAGVA